MSFRRKNTRSNEKVWREWLSEHAELLTQSGLPSIVLRDEGHWLDFLEHGYLYYHDDSTEFRVGQLTLRQKSALLRILLIQPKLLSIIVGQRITLDVVQAVEARYSADE